MLFSTIVPFLILFDPFSLGQTADVAALICIDQRFRSLGHVQRERKDLTGALSSYQQARPLQIRKKWLARHITTCSSVPLPQFSR